MTPSEFWNARAADPLADHGRVIADELVVQGARVDAHMRLLNLLPIHRLNANHLEAEG